MGEGIDETSLVESGGTESLSSYKALQLAVRNEERAFAFYAKVAALSPDATVREYADRMAEEELHHVALLRLERRHAWRAEHGGSAPYQSPNLKTASELRVWLTDRNAEAAARNRFSATVARRSNDPATAELLDQLAAKRAPGSAPTANGDLGDAVSLVQMLRSEILLEREEYDLLMRVVEDAHDPAMLALAQGAVTACLARLATLRDRMGRLGCRVRTYATLLITTEPNAASPVRRMHPPRHSPRHTRRPGSPRWRG